jgi:hypothetical protein
MQQELELMMKHAGLFLKKVGTAYLILIVIVFYLICFNKDEIKYTNSFDGYKVYKVEYKKKKVLIYLRKFGSTINQYYTISITREE